MDIPAFTKNLLDKFDEIRGKSINRENVEFWDLVVLTASDETQSNVYRQQIEGKLERNELPLNVEYLVYYDPPGPKIGCGGSTMYVISKLHKLFGNKLWDKRILLLNAGGQSQRLPSSSILGKIFMALPIRDPMYQLFDFKLACYLPFLKTMKPGIFHASADTVESYSLGTDEDVTFDRPGFTAVAHPSSLEIGRTHGVFVLDEQDKENNMKIASMRTCLEVLQKPSIENMRAKGAILSNSDGKEMVYTDSCFFFDHEVSKKLLDSYSEEPIQCEIDSYGDFLQGLGPRATEEYVNDVKNVSKIESKLVQTRKRIFLLLQNTPLNIVALNSSKFYHFGTMSEYVENLTINSVIANELGYEKQAFSVIEVTSQHKDVPNIGDYEIKKRKLGNSIEGCVMHSIFRSTRVHVGHGSVVEYCQFEVPIIFKENCIVSNCQLLDTKEKIYEIPENIFLHSAWVQYNGTSKAVTIALGIYDNVKRKVDQADVDKLILCGKPLSSLVKGYGTDDSLFTDQVFSLWTGKFFKVCDTMTESLHMTYSMYLKSPLETSAEMLDKSDLFSMQDIVRFKDIEKMLSYRNNLFTEINNINS